MYNNVDNSTLNNESRVTIDWPVSNAVDANTWRINIDNSDNYYKKLTVRGWTSQYNNTNGTLNVPANYGTFFFLVDVCGHESIVAPTVNPITATATYLVEVGANRSNSITFDAYDTDSVYYTWDNDPNSGSGADPTTVRQCQVIAYRLCNTASSSDLHPDSTTNSDSTFVSLFRTWDCNTRTYLIDTADNTTLLTTQVVYIMVKSRGNVEQFYPVRVTVTCGNEIIYHPLLPFEF